MFRDRPQPQNPTACFPRVRGDVPIIMFEQIKRYRFSPRARGCSHQNKNSAGGVLVFPACAGMFLGVRVSRVWRWSFPRVRGDVPIPPQCCPPWPQFSPRARGCSEYIFSLAAGPQVFPACAGMFLTYTDSRWSERRFPRVRGDVPFDHP